MGGFAVNYYAYHRFTEGMDSWIAASDANFGRLLEAIRKVFGEDLAELDGNFLKHNVSLYLGRVPNKIEVFQKASGVEFFQVYPRRVQSTLAGLPVKILPLDDLKTNKRASGRNEDLADLANRP